MGMRMQNLRELLINELKDIYSAESQIIKALPKMIKRASNETLKEALNDHLEETRQQVERLDQIAQEIGTKLTGKKCKAMEGLIEEGKEVLEAEGDEGVLDCAIIAASQRIEHYEISAYGTARALAEQLGEESIVELLQTTLDEEVAADEKCTEIAENELYPELKMGAEEDEEDSEEDEEEDEPRAKRRGKSQPSVSR